jgi:ATP-dependent RNA helicase RhlE
VLILTPTRELAAQVEESVRDLQQASRHQVDGDVRRRQHQSADPTLKSPRGYPGGHPGRLLDHVGQKTIDLSGIETLVLDEADRMLDMGFIRDIRRILPLLPAQRQNLLFSATFSDEIKSWPMAS